MQKEKIFEALDSLHTAKSAIDVAIFAINDLIGSLDASDSFANYRREKFQILPGGKEKSPAANAGGEKKKRNTALSFTSQEIEEMPDKLKKLFITGAIVAHVRQNRDSYEIRVQLHGKRITASGKKLNIAKVRFLQKLKEYGRMTELVQWNTPSMTFGEYSQKWLASRDPNIKPRTHEDYVTQLNDLNAAFGKKDLREIGQFEIMEYLNGLTKIGKARAARKRYQILKSLFEYAVVDDFIRHSPMLKVRIPVYEGETGEALTKAEELELVEKCLSGGTRSGAAYIFLLYTGIRRSELATAEIMDEAWIKVITAKQRAGRKEKSRLIPISPRLKKLLPDLEKELAGLKTLYPNRLSRTFKEWMPNHHMHELRHTFITRAQECGISRELVSLWAGHKADNTMTTNVYTHFSREFQLQEIRKFDY